MVDSKLLNFIRFCFSFSLTHAAVNCTLAFSSSLLGSDLSTYGNAAMYITYAVSTVLLSQPTLKWIGAKWTVLWGLCGLQLYVLSFLIAVQYPLVKWFIFVPGATAGGLGAGLLWTGQSAYYELNVESCILNRFSDKGFLPLSNFAGIFAFIYLSCEVVLQLLALAISLLDITTRIWITILFGAGIMFSFAGTLLVLTVENFSAKRNSVINSSSTQKNFFPSNQICNLSVDYKLLLFIPYQICFGLSSVLINYYVNKYIVSENYGPGYIGLVMAIDTLSSALAVYPVTLVSNAVGKRCLPILIACAIYMFNGCMLYFLSNTEIAKWQYLLPLFVSHGVSRCIWEGLNKALVIDLFPESCDRTFVAVYFWSGVSAGFSFFFYRYIPRSQFALLNISWALVAFLCFTCLQYISKIAPYALPIDRVISHPMHPSPILSERKISDCQEPLLLQS